MSVQPRKTSPRLFPMEIAAIISKIVAMPELHAHVQSSCPPGVSTICHVQNILRNKGLNLVITRPVGVTQEQVNVMDLSVDDHDEFDYGLSESKP